ncbi:hypothetical protein BGI30_07785 [Snodgrassella alvi]|uniref:hypothetical protein n=1 Tax=Snodgrassella alvi TaxID=1196083 RepID=UPI000C1E060F|nr:hypothetical protein [Snodgrassella alvi]PIT09032.1 hypothetical protein BGI30_07785 [Snodgrassella alvi]PIT58729.1 hypothetical protein BHC59_01445 [Snodgrassella alvi]
MCNRYLNHKYFDLVLIRLGINEYFEAYTIDVDDVDNGIKVTIVVYRLDTLEAYSFFEFYIEKPDKKECVIRAGERLVQLGKPVDWQKPHRYCIARHAFIILRNEKFKIDLEKNKLNSNDIYRYTLISQFKEAALIKKLNRLSDEEKIQLFTLKDWEIKLKDKELSNYSRKDILFKIHRRTYLYKRLLDKEKFKQYYIEYNKKIDQLYGEN